MTTIQLRRDLAARWASVNPILNSGELGIERDTGKAKLGDGATAWTGLPYWRPAGDASDVTSVNGQTGTVSLTAAQVGALPASGGTLTGELVIDKATGYALVASTDGTATSNGAFVADPAAGWFGIYDNVYSHIYYGISYDLPAPAGTATLGGYFQGLGVGGATANAGHPIFGVLNSAQSNEGLGDVAFTVIDNNKVYTFNNTLDDGSGGISANSLGVINGGGAISGANAGIDSAFANTLRLYNNCPGGITQIVNPNGAVEFWTGGNNYVTIAQSGQASFTAPGSGTTGSITTDDITVMPNGGISSSASMFLDNQAGQVFEFFNNSGGSFGVYDKTHSIQPFSISPNASASIGIGTDLSLATNGGVVRAYGPFNARYSAQFSRTALTHASSPYVPNAGADYFIGCDSSGGAIVLNLPSLGYDALVFIVKDEAGSAATHNITINAPSTYTIDGTSSATISANYGTVRLYSRGNNWNTW